MTRTTIANFEPHHIAQALLVRQAGRVAVVTMREQALMDDLDGDLPGLAALRGEFE